MMSGKVKNIIKQSRKDIVNLLEQAKEDVGKYDEISKIADLLNALECDLISEYLNEETIIGVSWNKNEFRYEYTIISEPKNDTSKVYVLREDKYHEWSWENGATEILLVSKNEKEIMEFIYKKTSEYETSDYIYEYYRNKEKNICGFLIYANREDYDNGKESADLVLEEFNV